MSFINDIARINKYPDKECKTGNYKSILDSFIIKIKEHPYINWYAVLTFPYATITVKREHNNEYYLAIDAQVAKDKKCSGYKYDRFIIDKDDVKPFVENLANYKKLMMIQFTIGPKSYLLS